MINRDNTKPAKPKRETMASITPIKVELPPSLPITRFVSTECWNPQRVGALAIYCSDGRWGDAFDEFCHRSLNIPRTTASRSRAGRRGSRA